MTEGWVAPRNYKVGIQPPAQHFVETFGPIYIGDGHHNNFEFHLHEVTPLLLPPDQLGLACLRLRD